MNISGNISGTNHVHNAHALKGPHRRPAPQQAQSPQRPQTVDQLDISAAASEAAATSEAGGIRADKVAEIRSQIASGSYETPEKLDAALDRLLDQFA